MTSTFVDVTEILPLIHSYVDRRFQPDKEFAGTDRSQRRDGPVQFEKEEEDPFGLDKFLTEAKKGKRSLDEPSRSRYGGKKLSQNSSTFSEQQQFVRQVTLRSATFRGSLRARAGIRKQIDVCDWTNDN